MTQTTDMNNNEEDIRFLFQLTSDKNHSNKTLSFSDMIFKEKLLEKGLSVNLPYEDLRINDILNDQKIFINIS